MTRWCRSARAAVWLAWAVSLLAHAAPAMQAASADGRWRAAADGPTLVIEDLTGTGQRRFLHGAALDGSSVSAVASIHDDAPRRCFVIAFLTLPELWELSYDPRAEPIYDGFVHDYKMGEGIAMPGFLNPRRTKLDAPLKDLVFDDSGAFVLGRASDGADGRARLHLVQLDVRRVIGRFAVAGDPDLAAARPRQRDGRSVIRVPDRGGGAATWVDVRNARLLPEHD